MDATAESTSTVERAVAAFIARRDRSEHPAGSFDKKRRWYPADGEWRACCNTVRTPSAAYPFSLMVHCRTAEHVAALHGVAVAEVRKGARRVSPPRRQGGTHYKSVRVVDGRYLSIYGEIEYVLGQPVTQAVRREHGGGFYVRRTPESALEAGREAARAFRAGEDVTLVVLRVECSGQYTVYECRCARCEDLRVSARWSAAPARERAEIAKHDKLAFSTVTPVAVETI